MDSIHINAHLSFSSEEHIRKSPFDNSKSPCNLDFKTANLLARHSSSICRTVTPNLGLYKNFTMFAHDLKAKPEHDTQFPPPIPTLSLHYRICNNHLSSLSLHYKVCNNHLRLCRKMLRDARQARLSCLLLQQLRDLCMVGL